MSALAKLGHHMAKVVLRKAAALPTRFVNPKRVRELVEAISRKHPEWGRRFVERNTLMIAKYAPRALLDVNFVEQILKKIYMYGGAEPSFMKELAEFDKSLQHSYGWW